MRRTLLFILILYNVCVGTSVAAEYAVANTTTPVLNTSDFAAVFGGTDGKTLRTDRCGQVRELEFIAMPGTLFTVIKKHLRGTIEICQVTSDEYRTAPNTALYVDSRFLNFDRTPSTRPKRLPPLDNIIAALRSAIGSAYVWGGNIKEGVPGIAAWYYKDKIADGDKKYTLAGLDCSGLLYHATGGWTPRNTSELVSYGKAVKIAGTGSSQIASRLQPLDLIIWSGHVIIVLDRQTAIESRLECGKPGNGGVVATPLAQRIAEIMRTRSPADLWPKVGKRRDIFVVRRWYEQ